MSALTPSTYIHTYTIKPPDPCTLFNQHSDQIIALENSIWLLWPAPPQRSRRTWEGPWLSQRRDTGGRRAKPYLAGDGHRGGPCLRAARPCDGRPTFSLGYQGYDTHSRGEWQHNVWSRHVAAPCRYRSILSSKYFFLILGIL